MKVTTPEAKLLAQFFNINLNVVPLSEWKEGLNAELEHKNVTGGDLITTAQIVIAHLEEFPDYYKRLNKMERKAKKYWKGRRKNIYM